MEREEGASENSPLVFKAQHGVKELCQPPRAICAQSDCRLLRGYRSVVCRCCIGCPSSIIQRNIIGKCPSGQHYQDCIRWKFDAGAIIKQDCPRLLEHMLHTRYTNVIQDSFYQGSSTLTSLWYGSNTMKTAFGSPAAMKPDGTFDIGAPTLQDLLAEEDWDYLVINDYSQNPGRLPLRAQGKIMLAKHYSPILREKGTTLVLLQTPAYEVPIIHHTKDLGDFEEFSKRTHEGYQEYVSVLKEQNCSVLLAPSGMATAYIRHHKPHLFPLLYAQDHYRPSPHGTWLHACVMYCTIVGEIAPQYDVHWWETSRYIQPGLPFPTEETAEEIRQVAARICGVPVS